MLVNYVNYYLNYWKLSYSNHSSIFELVIWILVSDTFYFYFQQNYFSHQPEMISLQWISLHKSRTCFGEGNSPFQIAMQINLSPWMDKLYINGKPNLSALFMIGKIIFFIQAWGKDVTYERTNKTVCKWSGKRYHLFESWLKSGPVLQQTKVNKIASFRRQLRA